MKEPENFIILVGKSGSGKTTVAEYLYKKFGLSQVQSYTTRPKRYENEQGHTFVTDEEFDKLENIVAYVEFDGYRYCTTEQQIEENQICVLDPVGLEYFFERYTGGKNIIVIYLRVNENIRWKRLRERDGVEAGERRMGADRKIFRGIEGTIDYVINNQTNIWYVAETIIGIWRGKLHSVDKEILKYANRNPYQEMLFSG